LSAANHARIKHSWILGLGHDLFGLLHQHGPHDPTLSSRHSRERGRGRRPAQLAHFLHDVALRYGVRSCGYRKTFATDIHTRRGGRSRHLTSDFATTITPTSMTFGCCCCPHAPTWRCGEAHRRG
jgi:hypothetical protein